MKKKKAAKNPLGRFCLIPFCSEGQLLFYPGVFEAVQTGHFILVNGWKLNGSFGSWGHFSTCYMYFWSVVLGLCKGSDEEDEDDGCYCFHDLRLLHYDNFRKAI